MLTLEKEEREALYAFTDTLFAPVWASLTREDAMQAINKLYEAFGDGLACALVDSVNRCHREGLLEGSPGDG